MNDHSATISWCVQDLMSIFARRSKNHHFSDPWGPPYWRSPPSFAKTKLFFYMKM